MELESSSNFRFIHLHIPRVAEGLKLFWGHAEFDDYVNGLMRDCRDGQRKGFPLPVATALMKLSREHDLAYPQFARARREGADFLPSYGPNAILAHGLR